MKIADLEDNFREMKSEKDVGELLDNGYRYMTYGRRAKQELEEEIHYVGLPTKDMPKVQPYIQIGKDIICGSVVFWVPNNCFDL